MGRCMWKKQVLAWHCSSLKFADGGACTYSALVCCRCILLLDSQAAGRPAAAVQEGAHSSNRSNSMQACQLAGCVCQGTRLLSGCAEPRPAGRVPVDIGNLVAAGAGGGRRAVPNAGAERGTGPSGLGDGGPAVPRHGAAQLTGLPKPRQEAVSVCTLVA